MKQINFFKKKDKSLTLTDPWLLENVENGIKATNIKELSDRIRPNKFIPIIYFENSRLFGFGAFQTSMKITELFKELQEETPETKGFIFGDYKYYFLNKGILRKKIDSDKEAFFSEDTLRNENVACYLKLVYSTEEDRIKTIIQELEDATTNRNDSTNRDRKRISCKNIK